MNNVFTRKLEQFAPLGDEDRHLLEQITSRTRRVEARIDLIREGDRPDDVHLILDGFACRYKLLEDGKRQIVAYLVPGDVCDLHVFILSEMDHSIATLAPCSVVDIPREAVLRLTERPALARALWWSALVDEAVLRERVVDLGRRSAEERMAHLLCELLLRLRAVGLADGDAFDLPVTQGELADSLGLSTVHVNRVLQTLRGRGLIAFESRRLIVLNPGGLMAFGGFNPNYLHLGREPSRATRAPGCADPSAASGPVGDATPWRPESC